MTHMSDVTNGASLEDSHTNFFALADLNQSNGMHQSNGINWRRLCSDNVVCFEPLDDPVLLSYSKCLSAGILCVWRRVAAHPKANVSNQSSFSNSNHFNHGKELWIFWYGEEPELANLVEPNLIEAERGSWESGLSYECRILLFKALHNLIEKCLLSEGYARLGRYFIEPQTAVQESASRSLIAFAFNFFVHGESTVCTSVDMRTSAPVYCLKKCHLQAALLGQQSIKVILSPYGMEGTLTGRVFRQNDVGISKMLSDWHSFYPNPKRHRLSKGNELPAAVEVIISGVRMKYPSSYVYVVKDDPIKACSKGGLKDVPTQSKACNVSLKRSNSSGPSTSPLMPTTANDNFKAPSLKKSTLKSQRIKENNTRSLQSSIIKLSTNKEVVTNRKNNPDDRVLWEFNNPSSKTTSRCVCPKKSASRISNLARENDPHSSWKSTKSQSMPPVTFHKRITNPEILEFSGYPLQSKLQSSTNTSVSVRGPSMNPNVASTSGPGGLRVLPKLHKPLTQPSPIHSNILSVETSSQICSLDPIMPTLSPHPKSDTLNVTYMESPDPDFGTLINIKEKQSLNEVLSPFHTSLLTYFENAKSSEFVVNSAINIGETQQKNLVSATEKDLGLNRPIVPIPHCDLQEDTDMVMSSLLYDYTDLNQFPSEPMRERKKRRWSSLDVSSEARKSCVVTEHGSFLSFTSGTRFAIIRSGAPKDPYEFIDMEDGIPSERYRVYPDVRLKEDDKSLTSPLSITSPDQVIQQFSQPSLHALEIASSQNDMKCPPPPSKTTHLKFIREEDLMVSVHDLDNIFDTWSSSSENDDITFPVSGVHNKGNAITVDDFSLKSKNSNMTTGLLDLSRMFPTPPSLEQSAVQSPLGSNGTSDKTMFEENFREKDQIEMNSCSAVDSKDDVLWAATDTWVFVVPPKYSPLPNLITSTYKMPDKYIYKPSWLRKTPEMIMSSSIQNRTNDNSFLKQSKHQFLPSSNDSASYHLNSSSDQRVFMGNDSKSPASNALYLNKTLSSVDDGGISPLAPEAHTLFVNLFLSDSMLNIFKDHNFDSCALCVCNMNIKGRDVGINLPNQLVPFSNDEPQYKCTCGFSAVTYRHQSYSAGLFYEDECVITGYRMNDSVLSSYIMKDCMDVKSETVLKSLDVPPSVVDLIKVQCKSLCSVFSIFHRPDPSTLIDVSEQPNALEISDGCEVCFLALEAGKHLTENAMNSKLDETLKPTCLHRWPYSIKPIPSTSRETMLHLGTLKPLLQEAVHKRNTQRLWEVTYVVEGPLTWRKFHRLAARGTEDQCEPQPVPSLTVGHDKDYLSLSPFALMYWDKLMLEPYSHPRDVVYIVVAPDNDYVLLQTKAFFHELSSIYETYRLGRHVPITKILRNGIMRVGRNAAMKLANEPVDEWFNQLSESPLCDKLKLYARVCRHHLAPHLAMLNIEKILSESTIGSTATTAKSGNIYGAVNSPMSQCQDHSEQATRIPDSENDSGSSGLAQSSNESSDEESKETPAIVIYIVEPFTYASVDRDVYRTATLGLLNCYSKMLRHLPQPILNSISLQLISLDTLLAFQSTHESKLMGEIKSLALSVYSQCHRLMSRQLSVKSLTGFGPAAAQATFLNLHEKFFYPLKTYNQFLVLASQKDKQAELGEMFGDRQEKSGILYCSYCLTEDRKWLVASCTNNNGEMMETTVINISTPVRSRQKCLAVRRFGLTKLFDFILEVLSNTTHPWRIIIGRLGHLGHGELRDWASLLSRKALLSYSQHLQELCKQCSGSSSGDMPSILSACLVSVEPDPVLRIMPDQYVRETHDNSNVCHLSTPEDASCTHILVFPTSATMQSSQATSHQEHIDPLPGGLGDDLFDALNDDEMNVGQDINDIFRWTDMGSPMQSNPSAFPSRDNMCHSSPNINGPHSPFHVGGSNRGSYLVSDYLDEPLQLLQQPLALGYYVSTAKTGRLPNWFWSSCPHLTNQIPVFLKFALLIHMPSIQQSSDDILHVNAPRHNCHPLDSNYTTDVLRYVLEGYNALSWLSLDPSSHDRRSCLPVHIQLLMQLYGIVEKLL